jgi:hypothetical protein
MCCAVPGGIAHQPQSIDVGMLQMQTGGLNIAFENATHASDSVLSTIQPMGVLDVHPL